MATNKNPMVSGVTKVSSMWSGTWKRISARRRWVGFGAIGLVAVALIALTVHNRRAVQKTVDAMRQTVTTTVQTVALAPTLQDLQKSARMNPNDAKAHLTLAHAYFDKGQRHAGIAEYERGLTLDPKAGNDQVAADLLSAFGTPEQMPAAHVIASFRLVEAQEGLEKLATSKQYGVRQTALGTLERMGRASHADFFHVWTLDLEAPSCDVRRHAMAKLGELGDRRAIPLIAEARAKDDKATAWYQLKCIGSRSDDAQKKILTQHDAKAQGATAHR